MEVKMKRSKYWLTMVDILDGQFPKGKCKERGRALMLVAFIEMMLTGTKFDENGLPEKWHKTGTLANIKHKVGTMPEICQDCFNLLKGRK